MCFVLLLVATVTVYLIDLLIGTLLLGRVKAAAVATEREWQQELLHLKKQQLLEEVLQQKEVLKQRQMLLDKLQEVIRNIT